jgi:diketogulonate reductase-like aldo/keto reductase
MKLRTVAPFCGLAIICWVLWGPEQVSLSDPALGEGSEEASSNSASKEQDKEADYDSKEAVGGVERQLNTAVTHLTVPNFMYGTAWKKERTTALVQMAIGEGFRAIDTANQQKHYNEALVGEALQQAYSHGELTRQDFFLQSKYSHGQWRDSTLSYKDQVKQSLKQSLEHLQTSYLDSLLLHGPLNKKSPTLPEGDWEVWRELERQQRQGAVRSIGVSNVNNDQLKELLLKAEVKPEFVQKRIFAVNG